MCGIVGIASTRSVLERERLDRQRDVLHHRGPDGAGAWWADDGRVGFGHRRLAIIDLSPLGSQPMLAEDGDLAISFNGEIYNYRELRRELEAHGHGFRSASDTEVLLAAYRQWGTDALRRLVGMFALAWYDGRTRQVVLARDRAGEKPLFYRCTANGLSFASELKALLAATDEPAVLDPEAFEHYLAWGYVPAPYSIVAGVRKLPPGHVLRFDVENGRSSVEAYWQLPVASEAREIDDDALTDELDRLLEDSVRRQLVADVPVGILLSGGIDSSLVAAMAARVSGAPVNTFTVSFPGHGAYDEAPYARLVASHFGTKHTELEAEAASVDLLPQLARQYDEPLADSSMVPTFLVSRLIRQHATVALGGDGGDELFGGYTTYSWLLKQEELRPMLPEPVRRAASFVAERAVPIGVRGRNFVLGHGGTLADSLTRMRTHFDARTRRGLLNPEWSRRLAGSPRPEQVMRERAAGSGSALQRVTAFDFLTYMPDDILVKVDRASMLTSLEVRAPWLDHRIIEFAFGRVPDRLRATATARKVLPKRLAARLLPPALDLQRKQGFSIPLARWFAGEWGSYIEQVLSEADPALFQRRAIERLIAGQRRGRSLTNHLFALTMFELWRREYGVAVA